MRVTELDDAEGRRSLGESMHRFVSDLYPICRSITGDGFRETLRLIGERIPLTIHTVPTGTRVFDWSVPKEWNIQDAYIKDSRGQRVVDFKTSNLHVVNYSVPIRARMRLRDLKEHLFTLPERPDWIPYRTSYYKESWGFCLSHRRFLDLEDDVYEVVIESSLQNGELNWGECFLPGEEEDEVLVSAHACHPSLCNDNLSGVAVAVFLARHLASRARRLSYRFIFIPTTIGSITWLARNEHAVSRIRHGLVLACLGDPGRSTYKKSRKGDAEIDRAAALVLRESGQDHEIVEFSPYGYDERQFCSPGFDLPIGSFMRTPNGRYPEYHTSADDLGLVRPDSLADSLAKCASILDVLDRNHAYVSLNPKCEPQLGKRGLYRSTGGQHQAPLDELALLWVLNLSDGRHTLLDVAERAGMPFESVRAAADALHAAGLLARERRDGHGRTT